MANKTTDLNEIAQLRRMAEGILDGKEYFVGTIANRLDAVAKEYPHDQAILLMQASMKKRFEKDGSLSTISQREFQSLYDGVCGLGNLEVLRTEFNDLLISPVDNKVANYNENFIDTLRGDGEQREVVEPSLVSEFETIFKEPGEKLATASYIESGRKGVELELASMGFANPTVEVAAQNNDFVVYAAEISTRVGRVPFLIPAEVKLGSVLLPSVFVSGNEFLDFSKNNIVQHAHSTQGKKLATPNAVMQTLAKLKGKNDMQKTAFSNQFDSDYIPESPGLYAELVEEGPAHGEGLDFPQVEVPKPLQGITDDVVSETLIEAGLSFDRDIVLKAKKALAVELESMGFRPDTVKIASEYAEGIVLATSIVGKGGKKTIQVPIEIKGEKVLMPSTFTSGVVAKSFNEKNLRSFADERIGGEFDAFFSDKHHMNFNELYNIALKSAAFGNFVEVEECLAVIDEKFGSSFHKMAFEDLMGLVRVGFNSESEKPLDEIDEYIKQASEQLRDKESNVKLSSKLLYLYPEDDQ